MAETIDCVIAGHICLDVTPEFPTGGKSVAEILRPGSLVQIGSPTVSTGGPVSNTGFPLRRLGNTVQLMGKCGDDMFGDALLDAIRREAPGAEAGMRIVPGEQTSYTVVVNPPGIDRIFLHCPGANDTFASDDVDVETVGNARLFHFGYPPLMARTYADNGAELVKILQAARGAGATVSLDMAYPDPSGPAAGADWESILAAALRHVDIFTPSVEELLLTTQRARFDELSRRAGDRELLGVIDLDTVRQLGEWCIGSGAAVALIKCGYLGLYVRTADADRLADTGRGGGTHIAETWADRELFQPSYQVDNIVSATGAGDCAIAGFLTALLRNQPIENALRIACAVGAQNLSAADSISGVRSWEETLREIDPSRPTNTPDVSTDPFTLNPRTGQYAGPADTQHH
jgi:sugar/nucleoside kinase (ribokinase family)